VGIQVTGVTRQPDGHLDITVSQGGDFSLYALTIDVPALDPRLRRVLFSFMASCPVEFDCRQKPDCPPPDLKEPLLDYLAKDYASFRKLLLDLLPHLNPEFVERNPADLGIALLELMAYWGDHLSYFQDAVANEAYLETLRQRVSARRHARLIDYRMHDGRNAWTYVHVGVSDPCSIDQGEKVLTRIVAPLAREASPPGAFFDESRITADSLESDPALASAVVFETTHPQELFVENNEVFIHAWGNEECCLAPGTTEAFLYAVPDTVSSTAVRPVLHEGDYLLLEEVRDPLTGSPADAEPSRRQVVRIDGEPAETEDPLYSDHVVVGALERWQPGDQALPLLRVRWRREDALAFPLCLSARPPRLEPLRNVSVARGNIVLADHGLTTRETFPPALPDAGPISLRLSRGPLTMHCEPTSSQYDGVTGRPKTARLDLSYGARDARPAVVLLVSFPAGSELWLAVPDLLDSPPFAQQFVAEVDDEGQAVLRFGDSEYGRELTDFSSVEAVFRIGNGRAGNVGAEALAHLAVSPAAPCWGLVRAVRNPLPGQDGTDPETIEEIRQRAPQAFRAEQFRAVTEGDYALAARKLPEVAGAVANFRWTGSWYTVFAGLDPIDSEDLILAPTGRTRLSSRLERRGRAFLTRYRLAGYDLEIRAPRFVPLEIDLEVCAAPGHFRTDVAGAVAEALSGRVLASGRRGFFHSDNFGFGQPVYLSRLYAAVERVEGVDSVVVRTFRRFAQPDNGELENGVLPIGPWEIAQHENDPNFMEHGVLRITADGGKA
jgi:hypothetical protein